MSNSDRLNDSKTTRVRTMHRHINATRVRHLTGSEQSARVLRLRRAALAVTFASTALMTMDAAAYTRLTCNGTVIRQPANAITMRASTSFGTSGGWLTPLTTAIQAVNSNPSAFRYALTTGDGSVGQNNNENEVWWEVPANISAPAVTYTRSNCSTARIVESDVVFRNSDPWTTSNNLNVHMSFGGTSRPFATTAIHELGHVGALGHTADLYSVMGQDFTHVHVNGNVATPYFGGDASRGMVDIYGTTAAVTDMSVTNMRRTGSSGGYSSHAQTRIRTSSNASLPTFRDVNGVLGYRVNKGQAVNAEFFAENLGNQWLTDISFNYYISTNNVISTGDTNIAGGILFNQPDGEVYPLNWGMTIPANLTSGQTYYLGILIDSNNTIAERSEGNNYTYLPILVN